MLLFNSWHAAWLDPLMVAISLKWIWVPLYLFLIWLLYRNFGWQGLWFVLALLIAIGINDQLTSGFMKPFFERLRPCHDPSLASLIHIVDGCGGKYGFVSGHASNSFVIATFFVNLWPNNPAIKWMLLWAAVIAYSRVYLGVHFPGDIIVGGMIGAIIGYIASLAATRLWSAKN